MPRYHGRPAGLPAPAWQLGLRHCRARAGGDGSHRHYGLLSGYAATDYALADAALTRVGMAHLGARDFTQLSGGEQQLVWLAQLSLQDAQVYLLAEPTQQLDPYYRRQVA